MNVLSEQVIVSLTAGLALAALAGYLVIKTRLRKGIAANILLGYLLLATAWNFLIFSQADPVLQHLVRLPYSAAILYPAIVLSFLIWSLSQRFLQTGARLLNYTIAGGAILVVMAALDFDLLTIPSLTVSSLGIEIGNAWLSSILAAGAILFYFGQSILLTIRARTRTDSPRHRNRLQIYLLALILTGAGIGLYLSQTLIVPEIGLVIQWLGAPILIYLVLFQDLPDMNTGLKALVHILVTTAVTLLFFGLTIYWLVNTISGVRNDRLIIAVVGAILLTIFYSPLRYMTQNLVERVLFRFRYNREQIIKQYIKSIENILLIHDLVAVSLDFLQQNLKIKRGAFFFLQRQDEAAYHFRIIPGRNNDHLPETISLKKNTPLTAALIDGGESVSQYTLDLHPDFNRIDPQAVETLKGMAFEQYVPIKRNEMLIGIIALGPYTSGAPYTLQDIELFLTLASQTAISLENARLFENVRRNLEEITRIKNLMDNVFTSIKSGVITASTGDEILLLNRAARDILSLPDSIRPGDHINHVLNMLADTALPALYRDAKSNRRSYRAYELTSQINGHGPVDLSIDLTPLRDTQQQMKGVAIVINDLTEKKRLKAVQGMFRRYLSPAVVDRLPSDPNELRLGGQRQDVSILFADIRGFTTFSEYQVPEDLITVLNKYLSLAAESILAFEGTLDKFMGDAVMAIFNAPLPQADHPLRAVKAAAAMQKAIDDFHQLTGDQAPKLSFGVGIHVGEAVVGNVGTTARMDYTAIGDAVNLAKRIQENTPAGTILLSENTYRLVGAFVKAAPYRKLTVKGRQEPEQTYELLEILPAAVGEMALQRHQ